MGHPRFISAQNLIMTTTPTLINSINFTHKAESMCVGLKNGFAIFTVNPLKKRIHRFYEDRQFGNAVTLHQSNIIVCVGIPDQAAFNDRTLCIFDETIGRIVFEVQCDDQIMGIYMLSNVFAIALKTEIRLYSFDPPMLHVQYRCSMNEFAPCDIVTVQNSYVVSFSGRQPGILRVVREERSDRQDISVQAHSHAISFIKLNDNASLVASASTLGTVIRVFDSYTLECVCQFRRGTLAAEICSIAFSPESQLMAVSSSKGTIHIFPITYTNPEEIQRAEMKISIQDMGPASLCFLSNEMLYAASKSGRCARLKINETTKTVQIEENVNFLDQVTIQ